MPGIGLVLSSPLIKLDDSKLTCINKSVAPLLSALIPHGLFPESIDPSYISRSTTGIINTISTFL